MSVERSDAEVSAALLASGVASPAMIEHARALQLRGYGGFAIGQLLVDLEHVAAEDLPFGPMPASPPSPPKDLTTFFAGARFDRKVDALDEEGLRARWTPDARDRVVDLDGVEIRFVNLLLLEHAQGVGSAFRVEAFDTPAIRRMRPGGVAVAFDESVPLPSFADRARLERCIWRLKYMMGLPPGPASADARLSIWAGKKLLTFWCACEQTARGPIVTVFRDCAWSGVDVPDDRAWDRCRACLVEAGAAMQDARWEEATKRWRAALHEATLLGERGILERVFALFQLASCFDRAGREVEAMPIVEEALKLVKSRELGPRTACSHYFLAASVEMQDLARRASLLEQAEALGSAPGVGRTWVVLAQLELAIAERCRGNHVGAREAAERGRIEDLRWFGASTQWGLRAIVESALASAALGDAAAAELAAREALEVAKALARPLAEAEWAMGAALAAAGRHAEAIAILDRAQSTSTRDEDTPFIELALARSLDALGRGPSAVEVARRARGRRMNGLHQHARVELEAIAQRAPFR